jgi:ribulose-phosphate 3-epimerase
MVNIRVVPAILVKDADELISRIKSVPSASILQIDLMDNIFVPNKTIGIKELKDKLPDKEIEYHLMVDKPIEWVKRLADGPKQIFQIHIESLKNEDDIAEIKELVKKKKSKLCWAINPPTPIKTIEQHMQGIYQVLIMTVNPGFSGQSYMLECEQKIKWLRKKFPDIIIEVDGGVTIDTAPGAIRAGANRLAAASALFKEDNPDKALVNFEKFANNI